MILLITLEAIIPRHTIQIQTADLISFFRFYDNCPRLPFFRHCAYLVAFIFLKLCIASLSVHDKGQGTVSDCISVFQKGLDQKMQE